MPFTFIKELELATLKTQYDQLYARQSHLYKKYMQPIISLVKRGRRRADETASSVFEGVIKTGVYGGGFKGKGGNVEVGAGTGGVKGLADAVVGEYREVRKRMDEIVKRGSGLL
jgi:hypothetical protein